MAKFLQEMISIHSYDNREHRNTRQWIQIKASLKKSIEKFSKSKTQTY